MNISDAGLLLVDSINTAMTMEPSGRGCGGSWQEASKILYGGKRLCTIPESDITPTAITRLSDPCTAGRRYDGNSNGIRCIIGSV